MTTTPRSTTCSKPKPPTQSDEDGLLELFFESLEISNDNDAADTAVKADSSNESSADASGKENVTGHDQQQVQVLPQPKATTSIGVPTTSPPSVKARTIKQAKNDEKSRFIGGAERKQSSWTEFQIDRTASTDNAGDAGHKPKDERKAPVSFSLKTAKGKKKKKKIKERTENDQKHGTSKSCDNAETTTLQQRPRWTAIVDTCCLLDDGCGTIKQIIRLAKSSQYIQDADPAYGLKAASLDEIELVIPHLIWSELDGIAKRPQGRWFRSDNSAERVKKAEDLAQRARGATKMLREEMEIEAAAFRKGHLLAVGYDRRVLKLQSMEEVKALSQKYLSSSGTSGGLVNDDHILACALEEKSKAGDAAVGGAILLTNDQNLACKALANAVRVFSPEEFYKLIWLRSEARKGILRETRGL